MDVGELLNHVKSLDSGETNIESAVGKLNGRKKTKKVWCFAGITSTPEIKNLNFISMSQIVLIDGAM